MLWLVTVAAAILIGLLVMGVLLWVKTPYYRPDRQQVQRLLQWVMLGQANENDWRMFCDIPIRHDPWLEDIRQQCEMIEDTHYAPERHTPYLFTTIGLKEIDLLLQEFSTRSLDS